NTEGNKLFFMQFSRSGRFIVSGTSQYDVLLWSLEDGKLNTTFSGHTAFTWGLDISSDDVFMASGGQDKTLRLWDLNQTDHKPGVVPLPDRMFSAAFAAGSPVLAIGIEHRGVWLVEVPTGSIVVKVNIASTSVLRFSATGNWLVHGDQVGGLNCWSIKDLLSDKRKTKQDAPATSEQDMKTPVRDSLKFGTRIS
ncbi:Jouberin, partial [Tulasnella sp. 403]